TSWRISDGVGSSILRSPHCSTTRFQYEPYALRQPSLTRADTTGMYSAKVGAAGLAAGAASRSAGVRPIRSSTSMAASTTACPGAPVRASGPVIVIGLLRHVPGRDERGEGLIHHRERVRGQGVLGGNCGEQDGVSGEQPAAVP